MKKVKKALLMIMCAALLVGGSIAGTLAYLTSQDKVENTFTIGNVIITMDEAAVNEYGELKYVETQESGETELADRVKENLYKLIPGRTYIKNPTIHVASESEACWLFVKIENSNNNATIKGLENNGWTQIEQSKYWAYKEATVGANFDVPVFDSFSYSAAVSDTTADAATKIEVTAYAIQADGFATSELAWAALADQLELE